MCNTVRRAKNVALTMLLQVLIDLRHTFASVAQTGGCATLPPAIARFWESTVVAVDDMVPRRINATLALTYDREFAPRPLITYDVASLT